MSAEEAIRNIEIAKAEVGWNYPKEYAIAFEIAFEIAIGALKKQIAKEPEDYVVETTMDSIIQEWACPNCGAVHFCDYRQNYCSECSQKIDWSDCDE